jgi:hypothetical protein
MLHFESHDFLNAACRIKHFAISINLLPWFDVTRASLSRIRRAKQKTAGRDSGH